ncbi:MAG: hypothetical protein CVU55_14550 [Deltaproteobacteria bacterium HGW-Deltaproteobacteria-13]|nr:MAG: hypothetical protein CVU55_14550 [Deltaproteobacteria bacterium HGW-Deltaproteobacteria-13]
MFDVSGFALKNIAARDGRHTAVMPATFVIPAHPACAGVNGPKSGECRRNPVFLSNMSQEQI